MFLHFKDRFPQLNVYWDKYLPLQKRQEVPAKTVRVEEVKISQNYIYIEQGCVRAFFNNNGDDKTVQFFFENDGLTSFESFVNRTPSFVTIETIEPSVIYLLPQKYVTQMMDELAGE